jgi:hypothetical protein
MPDAGDQPSMKVDSPFPKITGMMQLSGFWGFCYTPSLSRLTSIEAPIPA